MSLLEDIKPWIDEETGLITAPDGGRDNLPLMTATLMHLLGGSEALPWVGVVGIYSLKTCVVKGLYTVDYHRLQGMSPDNVVALCCVGESKNIYDYGKKSFWTYNVLRPGRFGFKSGVWFLIGFIPLIKISAGVKVNFFEKFLVFVSALINPWSGYSSTSNKCLQHLWNTQLDQNSWTVRLWNWQMNRKYPGGVKELYSIYFDSEHYPNFPFAKYAPDSF